MQSLDHLLTAVDAVREQWSRHEGSDLGSTGHGENLIELNRSLAAIRRAVDAVQCEVAAEIARASSADLGSESLAKREGFRSPTQLVAAINGMSTSDANKLIKVGEATQTRPRFGGEPAPARHPHVARALQGGQIGASAASAIITMLDRLSISIDKQLIDNAEKQLTEQAVGLSADQLAKVLLRAQAFLDPDDVARREAEARSDRTARIWERDGKLHLAASMDAETGAPLKAAIEMIVTAEFNAGRDAEREGAAEDLRTLPQRQADALATLARHVLGCDHTDMPLGGATLVVRVSLEDLKSETGFATVDGMEQPISIGAARRLAAGGDVIPCVLGADSEILDWGRRKRLFTKAQKLFLVERDGGCVNCGLPPNMTKVHHIRYWSHGGATDISNGVLLCETCHHRVHDNGWQITVEGTGAASRVWLIPPPDVDPQRTPRPGGRRRFDYVPAA
ncbi:DUF222 domain-containing protein [Microbacterium sp. C7(2022)]|uniref:HNH endonuclease n=1 Tax=Microbacterium sp. C7(2022) TaxID=2992759 RepID=UPI00237A17AC|nr:DUF222 domain-containing protein [Microbacterium sp. C7(2022)]MDE0546710.1 DUF222 domain-containing protein [Microbacterium sp. C7(2022)]